MKTVKTISLASFVLTLTNPNRGDQIQIGGGGKLIGQVTYSYDNTMFAITSTADGGVVGSHNASMMGKVNITFTQTSPDIDTLVNYILWCRSNPELAGEANITAKDSSNVFAFKASGCLPEKIPDNTLGAEANTRQFTFLCSELIPQEMIGGSN